MKQLLSLVLLCLSAWVLKAQELKNNSYYFFGAEKALSVNTNAFFIGSCANVNLGNIFQQYGYEIDTLESGIDSNSVDTVFFWSLVRINNSSLTSTAYNTLRNQLRYDDNLLTEDVLGPDTLLMPISYYFYVELENAGDTTTLDSIANLTGTVIVKRLPALTSWYELRTTTSSLGNSLEMANYFYETGLFTNTDPGFIYQFEAGGSCTPAPDNEFTNQWGLYNSQNTNYDINACEAWDITKGNSAIKLAIVDEGMSTGSEYSNFSTSYDAVTGTITNTYYGNHGDGVAGIAAASHNYNLLSGVAPNTTLINVSHSLVYWSGTTAAAELANGIEWAWKTGGADIINNSWEDVGNPGHLATQNAAQSNVLTKAIKNAIDNGRNGKGAIVVFIAGNGGNPTVAFPASVDPRILVVGNMAETGLRSGGSNKPSSYGAGLDLMAPGTDLPVLSDANNLGQGYATGTSYAAPHVSGVAALMLAVNDCLSGEDVRTIIEKTAQKVNPSTYTYGQWSNRPNGDWNWEMGYGLLDAKAAVDMAVAVKTTAKDLYIKDRPNDVGLEPNTDNLLWVSEDIWVRNLDDNKLEHQNPDYYADPTNHWVWVYVRVRNKGCTASSGNERLHLHWAKANSGGYWSYPWDGSFPVSPPEGGVINYSTSTQYAVLPVLQPGTSTIMKFKWTLPDPLAYSNDFVANISLGYFHFCLLARIKDPNNVDDIGIENSILLTNVKSKNNIVQKNISIIDFTGSSDDGALGMMADHSIVEVGNYNPGSSLTADLEFAAAAEEGNPITDEAEVRIILGDDIWDIWQNSGAESVGLSVENATKHILLVTDPYAKLSNLHFDPDTRGKIAVKINFLTEEVSEKEIFNYDLVQRDSTDTSIIGGNRFIIKKPARTESEMFLASGQYNLQTNAIELNANSISETASYKWYSLDTTLVDTGVNTTVAPAQNTTYLLEITADADGYKDYAEVNVPAVSQNYIVSLSPNPATNSVTASYHLDSTVQSATLTVVAASNTTQTLISQTLNVQQTQVVLNTSGLQPGVYIVNLVCGSNIQDGEQLMIQ